MTNVVRLNLLRLRYDAKFGHVTPYERNYGDPEEKCDPSRPVFQGRSRLELTHNLPDANDEL